jgi:hypothetical protein
VIMRARAAGGLRNVWVVRAATQSERQLRSWEQHVAIRAQPRASRHVGARPARDARGRAAVLCRDLLGFALVAVLAAFLPSTAGASTASVQTLGVATLVVTGEPGEANDVSIVRASDGLDYLIEDRGAPITPGSACATVDANHVNCQ